MASLKEYTGSNFITVNDVRDGPITDTIADVVQGKFEKLNVVFESGNRLGLNKTNARILRKLFGDDTDLAIGRTIEMYLGQIRYQGDDHDSVLIRPIAPPDEPEAKKDGDMDDATPF